MNEEEKYYELKIFKRVIEDYLDQTTSLTKIDLTNLLANRDKFVWDIATKIYQHSGHQVEFSFVREIVDARIKAIYEHVFKEVHHIAIEKARHQAETVAMESCHVAELKQVSQDPAFLDALNKLNGDKRKAMIFMTLRKVISEYSGIDESQVTVDSHLSSLSIVDGLDGLELIMVVEEEFDIEISDEIADDFLDQGFYFDWAGVDSGTVGEKCTVNNLLNIIYERHNFASTKVD